VEQGTDARRPGRGGGDEDVTSSRRVTGVSTSGFPLPPPRIYCILATEAPIALVFRRGPSRWFHLLRWRLDKGLLEPGVWVRKKLRPRRCDLSSDGELLLYYLSGGYEARYRVFAGLSRAPWLAPILTWDERDTFGRGWCFATDSTAHTYGERCDMDSTIGPVAIARNETVSFVNERRRGWVEAADCPPRDPDDTWDEKRSVILQKTCASNGCALRLIGGRYQPQRGIDGKAPHFELDLPSGERVAIPDVTWADWDQTGRLLLATRQGQLLARDPLGHPSETLEAHDLTNLTPAPAPPPDWAASPPPGRG
jgi:hypothetical protein